MSVVMKFGGTSVADESAIRRVTQIVRQQIERQPAGDRLPIVVVSALSKVTDGLLHVARSIEVGEGDQATARLSEIAERHVAIASALTSGARLEVVSRDLRAEFAAISDMARALSSLHEVSPQFFDAIAATGELASSRLVAAALEESGVAAAWVDARQVMRTDAEYTRAAPDMDVTCSRVRERVSPVLARGEVAVLGGFIGSTSDGVTTTLGRGGSDYSAAIFGACIDVSEIQIWTDVDGMLTADPRIVPHPRLVPQLSFAEASELAYFGAKVLHPSTILPAVSKNIPVRILNSRRPEAPGTLITADPEVAKGQLTAIACKRDVTVIDITSTRMFMAHGFLSRLFEVFERFKTAVDVVTTSEVSVSVTVDDARRVEPIVEQLREFAEVSLEGEMAIICAVGEDIHEDPKAFGRAVSALEAIPLRMVSQAASRRNITFVLRDADVPDAMTRLHDAFFGSEPNTGTTGA
ncbi:MAG: lysine-sensitive aspartokinase 3 [Acidobacteriota bacterium]